MAHIVTLKSARSIHVQTAYGEPIVAQLKSSLGAKWDSASRTWKVSRKYADALNALEGKGVHVITVNDYLARRDSAWMGQIYGFLGLSTGIIVHGLTDRERQTNYGCDISYGTNNEFGFDYLRDNMCVALDEQTQWGARGRDHVGG